MAQRAETSEANEHAAIGHRPDGPRVLLDERSGLLKGIAASATAPPVPLAFTAEVEAGGTEVAGPMGGLRPANTERHKAVSLVAGSQKHVTSGPEEHYTWHTDAGDWRMRWTLSFRKERPRMELRVAVTPLAAEREAILRDVHVHASLGADDLDGWRVEAPGNMLRAGVPAADIREPISVMTAADQLGSPGMVALHRDELTLVVWPLSRSESGQLTLEPAGGGLGLHLRTELAGAVPAGEWLEHGPIYLDLIDEPWDDLRGELRDWYGSVGVSTPTDQVAWASAANIFEVMVGSAPFRGGYEYRPYPAMADLIGDLDRIRDLGFDCLQLMPRHPYPSYNIHDPGDVAVTYGEPEELRQLIDACHERGMRLILDILLHGVLDEASIQHAVDVVHAGPYADRLDDPCSDPYTIESREISWCRHILEFAPFWIEGSPKHHPLLDAHPEWFMRDSAGEIAGVYTNALAITNEAWQDHFVDGCEAIVREYGIDGFRVDAPLYNDFANWSEATRQHASYSNLGALSLLRKLRRRLRAISPDMLVYSEPSGPIVRESLDLSYGYEEVWLVYSLFPEADAPDRDWRRVRNGRELSAWLRDFDAASAPGSVSAHFLDCHDTIWWRLPGDFWRRDQIGLPATKALLAVYALRGGAYMTFVGGEEGIEHELALAHRLRRTLPEIREGTADYDAVAIGDDAVYGVLRHIGERAALVVVNTSDAAVRTQCSVQLPDGVSVSNADELLDVWADERLPVPDATEGTLVLELDFAPYQARVVLLADYPSAAR